jgi:gamma-glutamyl-gamma-aminobutyrate hydrolase PuuD
VAGTPRRPPIVGLAPVRTRIPERIPVLAARITYLEALVQAGALPVVLGDIDPGAAAGYVRSLDGVVLPGGWDLNPRHYGESPDDTVELLDEDLGEFYLALARAALEARVPTLGICLGCQVMNVALGGSLVQHLGAPPEEPGVAHRTAAGEDNRHAIAIEAGTRLAAAMSEREPYVMSNHHQAIRRLGKGLRVTAYAPDRVVEGIEHPDLPFYVGIQWHPERSRGEASSVRLVESFVRVAGGREL